MEGNGSQPCQKSVSVWSQCVGCSCGGADGFPGSKKRWQPTNLRVFKNQHSWEHQTQDPHLALFNLINFICVYTETNILPAANLRSQRLEFLIIITIMSYTYSRLVFGSPKNKWLRCPKCSCNNSAKLWLFHSVWRSSQSVENYPFFFWVFPGSLDGRLNPSVSDGHLLSRDSFPYFYTRGKSHFVFWVLLILVVNLGKYI